MDKGNRQTAEQRATQRVRECHKPAVALLAIHPNQHPSSRFDGACHPPQGPPRMFEVMNDTDCKGNVEAVGEREIIGARAHDLDGREACEIAPRARERPLVEIDSAAAARPVSHRPIAVAAHAAADIKKAFAAPIGWRYVDRPAAKLFFIFGQDFGIGVPLEAKTIG